MTGSYVRLPLQGKLNPVGDKLLELANLTDVDEELPDIEQILDPLLVDTPIIVDGQILPIDDPRALMQLEIYVSNWIIRNAELISSEVIEACGDWPELRRYLLISDLNSTRELERLRNQLNSQNRWKYLIQRPIQLYESKRQLLRFKSVNIDILLLNESRDYDLRNLGWWQKQVTLLIEARDAILVSITGTTTS